MARTLKYTPENLMKGRDVEVLQERLALLGYSCGEVDGVFSEKVDRAVRAFQHDNELPTTGEADDATFFVIGLNH